MTKHNLQVHHAIIVDEAATITLQELCDSCGVQAELIMEMVEHGLLEPRGAAPADWQFTTIAVQRSRTALHLQQDLEVNWAGAALALDLLEEIEKLRARLRVLEGL
jgi:chaperone modulatory protein CbpM